MAIHRFIDCASLAAARKSMAVWPPGQASRKMMIREGSSSYDFILSVLFGL